MKGDKQKTEESCPQRNSLERERYEGAPTLVGIVGDGLVEVQLLSDRMLEYILKSMTGVVIGLDMDAGPIIFELSPSGTAFAAGSATYYNDTDVRTKILKTAEIAGHSNMWNGKRHYLLADVALVGKVIMLAMRTNIKP